MLVLGKSQETVLKGAHYRKNIFKLEGKGKNPTLLYKNIDGFGCMTKCLLIALFGSTSITNFNCCAVLPPHLPRAEMDITSFKRPMGSL